MIHFEFGHFVDFVTRDHADKLILVGVFTELKDNMRVRPIPFPGCTVVIGISASAADGTEHVVQLRLVDGNHDEVLHTEDTPVRMIPSRHGPGYRLRANLIAPFAPGAICVPDHGEYSFRVLLDGKDIGAVDVTVAPAD